MINRISKLNNILLLEKSHMVGSIIVSTARQLNLAVVRQVTSITNARQQLSNGTYSGLIATLDDEVADLEFLCELREAAHNDYANIPIAVITPACDEELAEQLKTLQVCRILIKPFKVRDVISTIELVIR